MKEIDLAGNSATAKDKNMYAILELVLEMYEREINFLPVDLYKSHSTKFLMEEDGIWNWKFELVEKVSKEALGEREKFWINFYDSKKFGLNEKNGG